MAAWQGFCGLIAWPSATGVSLADRSQVLMRHKVASPRGKAPGRYVAKPARKCHHGGSAFMGPLDGGRIGPSGRAGCRCVQSLAAPCMVGDVSSRHSWGFFRLANVVVAGSSPVSCSRFEKPPQVFGSAAAFLFRAPWVSGVRIAEVGAAVLGC